MDKDSFLSRDCIVHRLEATLACSNECFPQVSRTLHKSCTKHVLCRINHNSYIRFIASFRSCDI